MREKTQSVKCDRCGFVQEEKHISFSAARDAARKEGWRFLENISCPKCRTDLERLTGMRVHKYGVSRTNFQREIVKTPDIMKCAHNAFLLSKESDFVKFINHNFLDEFNEKYIAWAKNKIGADYERL